MENLLQFPTFPHDQIFKVFQVIFEVIISPFIVQYFYIPK